jgi:hypothetical protein
MALPTNVSYGTVTGRFLLAYADSSDVDPQPDGEPAKGFVIFTPSPIKLLDATASPAPVTILPAPVVANLNADGYIEGYFGDAGVRLVATDDPDINPEDWTWQVDFRLTDEDNTSISLPSFSFELPADEIIDLTTVSPVPSNNGTFYIVGPTGPQGPVGDGIDVVGTVDTSDDLPTTGVSYNDAYVTDDTGDLWIWSTSNAWLNIGNFRGAGVPAGGVANNFLIKSSSTNYDTEWSNIIDGGNA